MDFAAPVIQARRWKLLSGLAVAVLSAPLAWACMAEVMADRALPAGPRAALVWTPGRADLIAAAAEADADAAKTESQRAAADALARQALARGPLENRALRVLALDADRRGRLDEEARLMSVLGQRSLRDVQVQLWLAERALAGRAYDRAFTHMDVVLRRDGTVSRLLYPIMADALADPAAVRPLADRLAAQPECRTSFVLALAERGDRLDRARELLLELNRTQAPATGLEVGALVGRIAQDDYVRAREAWRQLVPHAAPGGAPLLYDGGFEGLAGPPPFNWRLGSDRGVDAELVRTTDGRPALQVQYSAARRSTLAEQVVVLAPGRYRLSGEVMAEQGDAPVALAWTLSCAQGDAPVLAEAPVAPRAPGWRDFSVEVRVPAVGCQAQKLRLANTPKDSFATAQAWFAELAIRPLAAEGAS